MNRIEGKGKVQYSYTARTPNTAAEYSVYTKNNNVESRENLINLNYSLNKLSIMIKIQIFSHKSIKSGFQYNFILKNSNNCNSLRKLLI